MKKINLLYLLAILAIISGLLLYYLPDMTSGHNAESNNTSQRRLFMILVRQS